MSVKERWTYLIINIYILEMKNRFSLVLLLCFFILSCTEKNNEIERIANLEYDLVTDSIFARMPGSILYQDGIVYWQDATSPTDFMHAVDVKTGMELAAFGDIGQGPAEFTLPLFSLASGGIYINDSNKPLEMLYKVDHKASVSTSSKQYVNVPDATRLLHLANSKILYLCPNEKQMFQLYQDNSATYCWGEHPIKNELANAYDIFQGNIAYNKHKGMLIYSSIQFPYIALFENTKDGNWELVKDMKGDIDYTVNEGRLKFSSDTGKGAMEIALTEDFIVLLQSDYDTEEYVSREQAGRDLSSLPHSLFVYDYKLNLKKIINMSFPMLRLCGDLESNTVYAISVNPEFELIKLEL